METLATGKQQKLVKIFALIAVILFVLSIFNGVTVRGTVQWLQITFDMVVPDMLERVQLVFHGRDLGDCIAHGFLLLRTVTQYAMGSLCVFFGGIPSNFVKAYHYVCYGYYDCYYNYYVYGHGYGLTIAEYAVIMQGLAKIACCAMLALSVVLGKKKSLPLIGATVCGSMLLLGTAPSFLSLLLSVVEFGLDGVGEFLVANIWIVSSVASLAGYAAFTLGMLGLCSPMRHKLPWLSKLFFLPAACLALGKISGTIDSCAHAVMIHRTIMNYSSSVAMSSNFSSSLLTLFSLRGWLLPAAMFFFCFWLVKGMSCPIGKREEVTHETEHAETVGESAAAIQDSNAQEAVSMQETESTQEAVPMQETESTQEAVPMQETESTQEAVPMQETESTQEPASVQESEEAKEAEIVVQVKAPPVVESVAAVAQKASENEHAEVLRAPEKKAEEKVQKAEDTPRAASEKPVIGIADELKKYKELWDMGVITEEEFSAMKKKLLGLG